MPKKVTFEPDDAAIRKAAETAVFGGPLADVSEYGNLIGDIADDAEVRVIFNRLFSKTDKCVPITISGRSSIHSSVVRLDKEMFDYSDCKVFDKGRGTGRKIFKLVAETAQRLGFKKIQAEGRKHISEKNPAENCWGHHVYPGYGFDQDIPPAIANKLPGYLAHFRRVLPLNDDLEGRKFWEKEGDTLDNMLFDLTPGSPSWMRLDKGSLIAPLPSQAAVAREPYDTPEKD
jgi:hypothetical protein